MNFKDILDSIDFSVLFLSSETQHNKHNKHNKHNYSSKFNQLQEKNKRMLSRSLGYLRPETTTLFLCDIQERFRPLIFQSETVIRRSVFINELCKTLEIPVITTEHYREVFGPTVPDFNLTGRVFQKRFQSTNLSISFDFFD